MEEKRFHAEAGEFITKDEAIKMHETFLDNTKKWGITNPTESVFYGINKIKKLLDKGGSVEGLKVYFAQEADRMTVVLAAADSNGNDIILCSGSLKGDGSDYLEKGEKCP